MTAESEAAKEMAIGFYDTLGAGRSIEFAYEMGCNAINMAGISEHLTPQLLKKTTKLNNFLEELNSDSLLSCGCCIKRNRRLKA